MQLGAYGKFDVNMSHHAQRRMSQRGISVHQVELALHYGRKVYSKGAVYRVIGKKEIARYADKEPELKKLDGLQVLVSSTSDKVITVYKNHDLSGIKPCQGRRH